MAETRTAPETDEAEDSELNEIAQASRTFDEATQRRLLTERGFSDAEADAFLAPQLAAHEREVKLLQRDQRRGMTDYTNGLKTQFPYAFDADGKALFGGASKAEMKRNAERLHNHTASIVGAAAPKKDDPAKITAAARPEPDEREEEWILPPAGAGEVVRDMTAADRASWDGQRRKAVTGKATELDAIKDDVMADIKANGPRQMQRRTIGQIASRQSQSAARAREAAKT